MEDKIPRSEEDMQEQNKRKRNGNAERWIGSLPPRNRDIRGKEDRRRRARGKLIAR
jgi:hypothetical protein